MRTEFVETPGQESLTAESQSLYSTIKPLLHTYVKFRWRSNWEYIVSALCYTFTPHALKAFIITSPAREPNLLQYLTMLVFLGLPVVYMQVYLGQYTQMGVLNLRQCLPIARGLSMSLVINGLLQVIKLGLLMTDFLMYFLVCLQTELPWTHCHADYKNQCYFMDKSVISKEKINFNRNDTFPPAYVYWRYIYMDSPSLKISDAQLGLPNIQKVIALLLTWGIVFAVVASLQLNYRKVCSRLFLTYFVSLSVIFFGILFSPGGSGGLITLTRHEFADFLSYHNWYVAVSVAVDELSLAQVYHTYAGSHLSQTSPAGTLCTLYVLLNAMLVIFTSYFTSMALELSKHKVGGNIFQRKKYGLQYETTTYFILMPQSLGFLTLPQMWSAIYFGSNVILLTANLLSYLTAIEMTIIDAHPKFKKYRIYVLGSICVSCILVSLCMLPETMYVITQHFMEDLLHDVELITTLFFCTLIFWVYGVRRLSDDVHFIIGLQPTKFWKICWYICPSILAMSVVYVLNSYVEYGTMLMFTSMVIITITMLPLPTFMAVEILAHIKNKKLLMLIEPTELWGPPDPEEKHMRRLFNPRTQTNYQSRKIVCQHRCLLGNKLLKNIVDEEKTCREDYLESCQKDDN